MISVTSVTSPRSGADNDSTLYSFTMNLGNNQRKFFFRPSPPPPPLSKPYSSPGVQDSYWCSQDFMLGAGMVLIQENTHKIVVVYETLKKYWFFPRGRKDVGESLEQTALREAYEEVCMVFLYCFVNELSILMKGVWEIVWLSRRVHASFYPSSCPRTTRRP